MARALLWPVGMLRILCLVVAGAMAGPALAQARPKAARVANARTSQARAEFRFDPATKLCRNSLGQTGFNVGPPAQCAELTGADLRGVDLSHADLRGARLRGADLRGAKLVGADLSFAVLAGARVDAQELACTTLVGALLDTALLVAIARVACASTHDAGLGP